MKKYIIGFLAVLAVTGCQPSNNSTSTVVSRNARVGSLAGQSLSSSGITLNGQLGGDDDTDFQTQVQGLASASIPSHYLGHVDDGSGSDGTGVFFGAHVSVAGTPGSTATRSVNSGSQLLILIWDEYAGQVDPSTGQTIPGIPIYMTNASGSVSGNQADITFTDNTYGVVEFVGTWDSNYFSGYMNYNNYVNANGGAGASGQMQFQIPTCSFFVCNQ